MHVSVHVFEVCVCACVHNHVSKTCLCVFVCKCVSLTSCTGQRKWGRTQSGPHLSVSLSRGRSIGPHTHTHTQLQVHCSHSVWADRLCMQQPAKELGSINVCTETVLCLCMLHERESETEKQKAMMCKCVCAAWWGEREGRDINRVAHIKYWERENNRERWEGETSL